MILAPPRILPTPQTMVLKTLSVTDGLVLEQELLDTIISGVTTADVCIWRVADHAMVVPRRLATPEIFDRSDMLFERFGYPVVVRDSGGGPVPLAPGVMNIAIAFIVPYQSRQYFGIESAYRALCEPLVHWLHDMGLASSIGPVVEAFCDGRFNITVGDRKVVGTAQRWRNIRDGHQAVLAHAILLVDPDVNELTHVTNAFYRLCGIDQHCNAESHTTLAIALAEVGRASIDEQADVLRLQTFYHDALERLPGRKSSVEPAFLAAMRKEGGIYDCCWPHHRNSEVSN